MYQVDLRELDFDRKQTFAKVVFGDLHQIYYFEKPKDLISEEEMVLLLTDLYIATAAKSYANKQDDKNIDYTFIVFEKYGIDSARFKRSNFYYTTKIDDYDKIYLQVQANIKTLKEKQTALIKVRDSIKRDSQRDIRKM